MFERLENILRLNVVILGPSRLYFRYNISKLLYMILIKVLCLPIETKHDINELN